MQKTDRLDRYMGDRDLSAVWFAQPNNFAWLTGADNVVVHGDLGVAAAGYDGDEITIVTSNIEANRFREEETPDLDVIDAPWFENSLADIVKKASPVPAAADFDVPGFDDLDASSLRRPLTDSDIDRYRALSEAVAVVLEDVARGVTPDDTEVEVAARLRGGLAAHRIDSPVALVGGGERASVYRHYTPQDVELGSYALLAVTATRDGLYTSATRTVAFDPPAWLEERTVVAQRVETTAIAATRAVAEDGATAAAVFAAIEAAYADQGWEGEWRNHHQGGAAGYAGREWFATPTAETTVRLPMAFAYNPTVQGAASEDTILVTMDGVEILSETGEWPTRTVDAVGYDLSIERPGVLER